MKIKREKLELAKRNYLSILEQLNKLVKVVRDDIEATDFENAHAETLTESFTEACSFISTYLILSDDEEIDITDSTQLKAISDLIVNYDDTMKMYKEAFEEYKKDTK